MGIRIIIGMCKYAGAHEDDTCIFHGGHGGARPLCVGDPTIAMIGVKPRLNQGSQLG